MNIKIISHQENEGNIIRRMREDIAYIDDLELGEHLFQPRQLLSHRSQVTIARLFSLSERLKRENLAKRELHHPQYVDWTIYLMGKVQANLSNILLESLFRAMVEPDERYPALFRALRKSVDQLSEALGFLHGYEQRRYVEEVGHVSVADVLPFTDLEIPEQELRYEKIFAHGSQSILRRYYELARKLLRQNIAEINLDDTKLSNQLFLLIEDISVRLSAIFAESVSKALVKADERYSELFCALKFHIDLLEESKGFLLGYSYRQQIARQR